MHHVFIMDDPATIIVDEDTTYTLMQAAQRRGDRIDHCLISDLIYDRGVLYARTRRVKTTGDQEQPLILEPRQRVSLTDVDLVWIRKDPPFDDHYLWATLLLENIRDKTRIINDPRGLRDANEKLYALHFSEFMPETLITRSFEDIGAFQKELGSDCVIKQLNGRGGEGIFLLRQEDFNRKSIIENATGFGSRLAQVQRFIPQVRQGDKRILIWDGQVLGGIVRLPQADDFRSNIHVGGSVQATTLTERDQQIAETVGKRAYRDGLRFVGLDVIHGMLTEINVTSPTGLQQLCRLSRQDYAMQIIEEACSP